MESKSAKNINGVITKILPVESGVSANGKEWQKQNIIIEQTEEEFNKDLCITFFGKNMSMINDKQVGSKVSVSINISSREYNGKYFHNINGWFMAELNTPDMPIPTSDDNPF